MTRLIIDILDEADKDSVLNKLDEFQGKHWIQYRPFSATALPGKPMTDMELNELIDEAENSPLLSAEDFKARFAL